VRAQLEKKLHYINESLKDDQWICGRASPSPMLSVYRAALGARLS
jgi:glutathione S-transferase